MINHNKVRNVGRYIRDMWLKLADPRRLDELAGGRVVFDTLKRRGFLNGFEGKRILEIGPKHGKDSLLLATLNPSELVLIDLPEKDSMVGAWLSQLSCSTSYLEGNVLYLTKKQCEKLGRFDLVWCSGVLYHNAEQLRLLKRLFNLCSVGGWL